MTLMPTDCHRCNGKGTLSTTLGVPDPDRDTHAPYTGPWVTFEARPCPVCKGQGTRVERPNTLAGWRIRLSRQGVPYERTPLPRKGKMYTPQHLREMSEHLIDLAQRIGPEGEGLDLTDEDFDQEQVVQLRVNLSSMRKAIDVVNKGLAKYWAKHKWNRYEYGDTEYYLNQLKGKRLIDPDAFYEWLAQQDADKLKSLVSVSSIKVGGFTPVERETFLDETPTSNDVSIGNKPRRF